MHITYIMILGIVDIKREKCTLKGSDLWDVVHKKKKRNIFLYSLLPVYAPKTL